MDKKNHLEKYIGWSKNLSLIIIIPALFLLTQEYESIKNILVLLLAILFLIEGAIIFSEQRTTSFINLLVGVFLIGMVIVL